LIKHIELAARWQGVRRNVGATKRNEVSVDVRRSLTSQASSSKAMCWQLLAEWVSNLLLSNSSVGKNRGNEWRRICKDEILKYLHFSRFSYREEHNLQDSYPQLGGGSCVLQKFIDKRSTDTQVFVSIVKHAQRPSEVIIAFRGTQPTKWKDIYTDLNLLTTRFLDGESEDSFCNIRVHSGFKNAWMSVREEVVSMLEDFHRSGTIDIACCNVVLTGHSLGGAIATVCAYDFIRRGSLGLNSKQVSIITFGAPKVGNYAFAIELNKLSASRMIRVVGARDIIARVPPHCFHSGQCYNLRVPRMRKDCLERGITFNSKFRSTILSIIFIDVFVRFFPLWAVWIYVHGYFGGLKKKSVSQGGRVPANKFESMIDDYSVGFEKFLIIFPILACLSGVYFLYKMLSNHLLSQYATSLEKVPDSRLLNKNKASIEPV